MCLLSEVKKATVRIQIKQTIKIERTRYSFMCLLSEVKKATVRSQLLS